MENNNKIYTAKISEANKEIQNLKILCNKLQSEKKGYEIIINNLTKKVSNLEGEINRKNNIIKQNSNENAVLTKIISNV